MLLKQKKHNIDLFYFLNYLSEQIYTWLKKQSKSIDYTIKHL